MKLKYSLCALFMGLSLYFSAQINQLDVAGKKHGKWIIYLDKNWAKTKDTTKASYYRYSFYDHGVHVYPMGECGGKGYTLKGPEGKILNGEYKWYDARGRLSSVHEFKNGEYISCKEYFTTGELQQYFDYTKKYQGQEQSWCVTVYDKKGKVILESYTYKDQKGHWPKMRG